MSALSHLEAHQISRDLGCLMSSRELAASATFVPADAGHTSRADGGVVAAVRRWWMRRRTVSELRRLPDPLLRDIGIDREHIEDVAHALTSNARERSLVA